MQNSPAEQLLIWPRLDPHLSISIRQDVRWKWMKSKIALHKFLPNGSWEIALNKEEEKIKRNQNSVGKWEKMAKNHKDMPSANTYRTIGVREKEKERKITPSDQWEQNERLGKSGRGKDREIIGQKLHKGNTGWLFPRDKKLDFFRIYRRFE